MWVYLWCLLLIIPGIIKSIAYSMSMYIIADNPNVGVRNALKLSMKMTKGYKMDIFVMYLSFIGWNILCVFTLGIGSLWLMPYMQTTYSNMYHRLKKISIENGVCTEQEFKGEVHPVLK